ncbi:hypothetical protein V6N11_071812 [Hibiscus sabdariffa]|uniref:Uncharacterized protein n=1 Tax=Hibiscus sabdariffa TaxID=183260 RepID=A0ABR2U157_9ROSI
MNNGDEVDYIFDVEKNDDGDDAYSHKRKTHNNNRLSIIAKRSRSEASVVTTTADSSTHGVDSTEDVG